MRVTIDLVAIDQGDGEAGSCRHCDGRLIGSELAHGTCGDCGGRAVEVGLTATAG